MSSLGEERGHNTIYDARVDPLDGISLGRGAAGVRQRLEACTSRRDKRLAASPLRPLGPEG